MRHGEWEPLFDAGCVTGRPRVITDSEKRENIMHWYKGSIHNHSNQSDGDSSPSTLVDWYKRHGYNFVILTDHNRVTPVENLNREFASEGEFIVLPGEEISDGYPRTPEYGPVHVNALGVTSSIEPRGGADPVAVLRADIDAVNAAGGLPMVNHPNFRWSLTANDLFPVEGWSLLEFMNCGAAVNNTGLDQPDTEAIWDDLLHRGKRLYGTASDDSHHFTLFTPRRDNPGRGWVMVRCETLTPASLLDALSHGEFYSSTGVILKDAALTPERIALAIEPWGDTAFRTEFIGRGGKVLKTVYGPDAEYIPERTEGYVRARITDSNNLHAWTQPVFF